MTKRLTASLIFSFLLVIFSLDLRAQAAACSGTMSTTGLPTYGSGYTMIGNGTVGSIRICISSNGIDASCMGVSDAIVIDDNGAGNVAAWFSTTANGTCYTLTTTTGYAYLAFQQDGCGGTGAAVLSWTTVNGSGTNVCPTCSDGIQNGSETGIDCGGSCPACAGNCFNGIQDGTETGIDCGGSCAAVCGTCFDGIRNGTETGIDCGGSCALVCTTNTGTVSSTCATCPTGATATVYTTVCAQVGTTAYNLNSPAISMEACTGYTAPVPSPTCGTVGSYGAWIHVDLAPGVTQVQLAFDGGSVATGNSNSYASAYQGTSCSALTAVPGGCQNSVQFASGAYAAYQVFFNNLNPGQDLWIFMYNDAGKDFDLDYHLVGTATAPSNTTCATSAAAAGTACNLGAPGNTTFTPPTAAGQTCTGGNWSSNENTTFYTFTPTASTATLNVIGITCNDGTSGAAQFAVWTSCAAIGTYTSTSTYLGCVVGTSNLTMSGLVAGQTYYIATDGAGGDNCKWTFSGTNISLPIDLIDFQARFNGRSVDLTWATASEKNNAYFTIEKSKDGDNWEVVTVIKGAGTSNMILNYSSVDNSPYQGLTYYRLKQTDKNGDYKYSGIDAVNIKGSQLFQIIPNPAINTAQVIFTCFEEEVTTLEVFDYSGRKVISRDIACTNGQNVSTIDLSEQSKGIYFVVLTSGHEVYKAKLIKSE